MNLTGSGVVETGGVLVTAAGSGATIAGGGSNVLEPGSTANEMVLFDYSTLNITAPVINNGSNKTAVTLAGSGTTTLAGLNTYTGATAVLSGQTNLSGTVGADCHCRQRGRL